MNTSTQILTLAPLLILATLRVEAVDLAALKADAEITFREGVKPFVNNSPYSLPRPSPRSRDQPQVGAQEPWQYLLVHNSEKGGRECEDA